MNEEENGIEETLTQDDGTELDIDLSEDDGNDEEIDWKAEAEKKNKAYEDQKKRAEIAEGKLKKPSARPAQAKGDIELSTRDTIVLMKSNVDEDDIDEVVKFARYQGVPVSEALKSTALKAILEERSEKRNVAQASHSGASRRGTSKLSDDAILSNASKGILPESDADFERLADLRMKRGTR